MTRRSSTRLTALAVALAAATLSPGGLRAQQPPGGRGPQPFDGIDWKVGPCDGNIGTVAQIRVPQGYRFAEQKDMRKLMDQTGNLYSPHDLAALENIQDGWFILFSFDEIGYVKDDEKDKLDPDGLLKSLREGNEEANKEKLKKGFDTITDLAWQQPPFFDEQTHNLTWCIRGMSRGHTLINYNSKILGRRGVMDANMVGVEPEDVAKSVPVYKQVLAGFSFKPGQTYGEWRDGDKVAAIGLSALVVGGAAAVAAKTGLLAKLIKPIIAGIVVVGGAIASFFRKIFGRSRASE